jgi:anthranilate/para-aminobenzoate synthase component I
VIFSHFRWNKSTVLKLSEAETAYIYYRQSRLNLVTGYPEVYPLQKFLDSLEAVDLQDEFKSPAVFHFYYEFGLVLMGLSHTIKDNTPLAIEINYKKAIKKKSKTPRLKSVPLQSLERPSWSEYKEAFKFIQGKLLSGDCYQVNLTYPFDFQTDEVIDPRDLADYLLSQDGAGAYAHATYLGDEMILSNSPECLFQYSDQEIFTMPIKGTIDEGKDWKKSWKKLLENPKEEGELIMITDLLKNDLNKLSRPKARVKKLRAPLRVPGLVHQYSLIALKLEDEVSLLQTMKSLFPGGSITGAPKKRVMQILQDVERYERGMYCGSTLLCWGKRKCASINIRTAKVNVDDRLWRYGAGGGITLLSEPVREYQEMEAKVSSFLTLLKAPGYAKKP